MLSQVLTVGTANGLLVTYLASLPSILAAAGTKHAMLTSLGEMTVHDVSTHSSTLVRVDCEPSFCSLGPRHLAVGVNNQVLFYAHGTTPGQLANRRSYLGGVHAVCLNDTYAAVLTDGRVLVHTIEEGDQGAEAGDDMCLPQPGAVRPELITCMALSRHFLVTATGNGAVCYHMVQDGALATVNEYRHTGKTAACQCVNMPPISRLQQDAHAGQPGAGVPGNPLGLPEAEAECAHRHACRLAACHCELVRIVAVWLQVAV